MYEKAYVLLVASEENRSFYTQIVFCLFVCLYSLFSSSCSSSSFLTLSMSGGNASVKTRVSVERDDSRPGPTSVACFLLLIKLQWHYIYKSCTIRENLSWNLGMI